MSRRSSTRIAQTATVPGEIGPMSLITYNDARPWAKSIATHVANGTMPPWHADPAHGEFLNDRRLSDADRDTIVKWASGGAPEGNKADLPAPPTFADGWQMGQPDVVFAMQEDYPIPAEGTIDYKWFEVPTNLTEDKWVQAMEITTGRSHERAPRHRVHADAAAGPAGRGAARRRGRRGQASAADAAVHDGRGHGPAAHRAERRSRAGRKRSAADPEAGRVAGRLRAGPGRPRLPAGHGDEDSGRLDRSSCRCTTPRTAKRRPIARVSASSTRRRRRKTEVRFVALTNQNFVLPAGAPDTRVDAEVTMDQDITLWSVLPHTHVRGKKWKSRRSIRTAARKSS